MFLGVQENGIQRRGDLTHLFVPDPQRRLPFRNAQAQLGRLRKELRRVVFPKNARPVAGGNAPRTVRVVFRITDPRQPPEPLQKFLKREEGGVRQHLDLLDPPARPPPRVDCLTNVFQLEPFVPRIHFAGYHPALDAYVTVMDYAPGSKPSPSTSPAGLAAVERALFTLWVRGVALPDISREGVRVSKAGATIVDFTNWRNPMKNLRAVQASRNPLFSGLWDPPAWLPGLLRRTNAARLDTARRAAWLWSPACNATPARGNNSVV